MSLWKFLRSPRLQGHELRRTSGSSDLGCWCASTTGRLASLLRKPVPPRPERLASPQERPVPLSVRSSASSSAEPLVPVPIVAEVPNEEAVDEPMVPDTPFPSEQVVPQALGQVDQERVTTLPPQPDGLEEEHASALLTPHLKTVVLKSWLLRRLTQRSAGLPTKQSRRR